MEASHEKEVAAKSQLAELARAIEATELLFNDAAHAAASLTPWSGCASCTARHAS